MDLSPADRRTLKIIGQNIILSSHVLDGDVIDPGTGKRVIPDETADRLIAAGLASWEWTDDYEEYRLTLTDEGDRESRVPTS